MAEQELAAAELVQGEQGKKISTTGETKQRDFIQLRYRRFQRAMLARQDREKIWETLDQFDRSEQWKDANIPPWVPKPVTNYIRWYRQLKRANLAAAIPKPSFSAVHPMDKDYITQLQNAHDHVWQTEKIEREVRRAIDRALLYGTSVVMVATDEDHVSGKYFKKGDPRNALYQGKVYVKKFPIQNFFPDPDAYNLQMCKFIETTELMPLSVVKRNKLFRDYAGKNLENLTVANAYLERDQSSSGNIFERDYDPVMDSVGYLPGDELVTLHTHWERYMNDDGKWQLDCTYYIRNTNFILYRIEDMQPNEYPFAVYYDEEEDNEFWGKSGAMDILENQKVLNKLDQTAAIIATLHQNPQKVVLRESGINAQELARTGTLPGKVWASNIPNPIEIVQHPDIPRGIFDLKQALQADIQNITGANDAYTGSNVGSLTTSTGVNDLIDRATVRDKDKMIQVDEFVERISHLIVLNILHKWKENRPISVTGPDGQPMFDEYVPPTTQVQGQNGQIKQVPIDPDNIEWRVTSNVYAKAPMTQATKRQQVTQLLQWQGQFQFQPAVITPEEAIQGYEFDNAHDILQRMAQDRQIMTQNQQQQQQQPKLSDFIKASGQEIKFSMQSNDQNLILDTLEQIEQAAQQKAQNAQQLAQQLDAAHGLAPQGPPPSQGGAPNAPQAPNGAPGAVQMGAMTKGGM